MHNTPCVQEIHKHFTVLRYALKAPKKKKKTTVFFCNTKIFLMNNKNFIKEEKQNTKL